MLSHALSHPLSQKHRKVTPNSHMRNTNVHLIPKGAVKVDQIKNKKTIELACT